MGLQFLDRAVRRPVRKAALRQALVADPEALAVVAQNFDCGAPAIPENEQPAAKGIGVQMRTAHPRQTIDAGAKINARHLHQDPHLRRELDHEAPQPDLHNCNTISAAAPGAICSCSLCPSTLRSDTRHSLPLAGSAPVNSTNFTAF